MHDPNKWTRLGYWGMKNLKSFLWWLKMTKTVGSQNLSQSLEKTKSINFENNVFSRIERLVSLFLNSMLCVLKPSLGTTIYRFRLLGVVVEVGLRESLLHKDSVEGTLSPLEPHSMERLFSPCAHLGLGFNNNPFHLKPKAWVWALSLLKCSSKRYAHEWNSLTQTSQLDVVRLSIAYAVLTNSWNNLFLFF